jgi:hypothetical protein
LLDLLAERERAAGEHRGASVRTAKGFIPGTHAFLDRLEAHIAGASIPNWSQRYAEAAPAYPSWA